MPKNTEKRRHSADLRIRLLEEHKELIVEAAEHSGASLSDWARLVLIREARKELGKKSGK